MWGVLCIAYSYQTVSEHTVPTVANVIPIGLLAKEKRSFTKINIQTGGSKNYEGQHNEAVAKSMWASVKWHVDSSTDPTAE